MEKAGLELTAIIEPIGWPEGDEEPDEERSVRYKYALETMEQHQIRVLTIVLTSACRRDRPHGAWRLAPDGDGIIEPNERLSYRRDERLSYRWRGHGKQERLRSASFLALTCCGSSPFPTKHASFLHIALPTGFFNMPSRRSRGDLKIIIAAAGGAAHLPGMIAAKTILPVLAVPVPSTCLQGIDSLLSIVQMPKGVPVATLAIGKPGAANAALLAVAILAGHDPELGNRLRAWRQARSREVLEAELPS